MKHTILPALVAVSLATSLSSYAEEAGFTITPMVGYMDFDSDRTALDDPAADPSSYDEAGFVGIGLGYRTAGPWQIELAYVDGDTDTDFGDVDFTTLRLDGLYFVDSDNSVVPYWVIGMGQNQFDEPTIKREETMVNYGAGFSYAINDALSTRADLRGITSLDEEDTDIALTVGLQWFLAAASRPAPAPAPEPAAPGDADNDGVSDDRDNCPNTPAGVEVDSNGCALDDDNDGVPNHKDECPDTDAGARVDSVGCYIILKGSKEIELNVNFANNSSVVESEYFDEIRAVADFMKQYRVTEAVIEGHTDSSGSDAYNQQLSERRANKVADVLVEEFGVDASRVSAIGYGEARPIADNDTAAGRSANRRVVAVISATVEERAE